MNETVVRNAHMAFGAAVAARPPTAMVTASYAADLERCRLLCDTMDRFVTGSDRHYILVEPRDVALFRQLEGPRRTVVDERELLPPWLHAWWDPTSLFRRRVWVSLRTQPMRGWHVQQLRRIAIAAHIAEGLLAYCDSDVAFLKPFDCDAFWRDGKARLFRRDGGLPEGGLGNHRIWSRNAGAVLGIVSPAVSPHDYVGTLIAWRRDAVLGMCERIEAVTGRPWPEALGRDRRFSECILYGRYADEVLRSGHFHDARELCKVHWEGQAMDEAALRRFVEAMEPGQVAIGLQSFIGTDLARIRRLIEAR